MDYNILILRKITGQITGSEMNILEQWLSQSAVNQQHFNEIKLIWDESEFLPGSTTLSAEEFGYEFMKFKKSVNDSLSLEKRFAKIESFSTYKSLVIVGLMFTTIALVAAYRLVDPYTNRVQVARQEFGTKVTLRDSSQIILNDSTNVTIQNSQKNENISITGEAIIKTNKRKMPLKVWVGDAEISLDSSEVLVKHHRQQKVEVFVISGAPEILAYERRITAFPGEIINFDESEHLVNRSICLDANIDAWHTRKFDFRATPLRDVLHQIGAVYHIEFTPPLDSVLDCRFTGTFNNTSIEDILKTLAYSVDIEFIHQHKNQYAVSGPGCVP